MGKKRSDIEILADILKVANDGAKKSHIVYKANLNFKIVRNYLNILKNSGLIAGPEGRSNLYQTTEKGVEYINHFETFKTLMK